MLYFNNEIELSLINSRLNEKHDRYERTESEINW
jgi:hypothetical protein